MDTAAAYNLACAYFPLKRAREAVQSLERTVVLQPSLREDATVDEKFENIREDGGFARLLMGI